MNNFFVKFSVSALSALTLFSAGVVGASAKRVRESYDYNKNTITGGMSDLRNVHWINVDNDARVVDHVDNKIGSGGWNYDVYHRQNIWDEVNN